MGNVTFEHQYLNAGFDYLKASDQSLPTVAKVESHGYSVWATPRLPRADGSSFEALLRYDHFTPNTSDTFAPSSSAPSATTTLDSQKQNRIVAGLAYWFPHQGNVSTAILVDYDGQRFDNITTAPTKAVAVHGLLNF
jgi:hypothetical protein